MEEKKLRVNMLAGATAVINGCILFYLGIFTSGGLESLGIIPKNVFYLFIIIGLGLHAVGIYQESKKSNLMLAHILGFLGCVLFLINPFMAVKLSILFFIACILISIKLYKNK